MREVDLFGVFVSPFLRDLAAAALAFVPVKLALDWAGIDRFVWHRPLFDMALFGCALTAMTFASVQVSAW